MRRFRIGLLGCGTVGGGFVRLLEREHDRIATQFGLDLALSGVLVRDLDRRREGVPRNMLTNSPLDVIDRDCDIVVELIGGTHTAGALVRRAIARGLDVVTANKSLLATDAAVLFEAAARAGVQIGFEASVCGAIPVIAAIQRGLAGDSIESLSGILNGTTNYVLSRMAEGVDQLEAVTLAQARGFAEADPSFDLSGVDAAQKLAVLTLVAFQAPIRSIQATGIEWLSLDEVERAQRAGFVYRSIGEAKLMGGAVEIEVGARRIAQNHPFATVMDERNALLVRGRAFGEISFAGPGAGAMPTAVAVLSDVVRIAGRRKAVADREQPATTNILNRERREAMDRGHVVNMAFEG